MIAMEDSADDSVRKWVVAWKNEVMEKLALSLKAKE